jgi:hypothetical protein
MKKLEILITISSIVLSGIINAQESAPIDFTSQVSVTPFSIVDSENPSLRISYEHKISPSNGILVQGGWIYPLYNRDRIHETNSTNAGFMSAVEIRHYWPSENNGNFYTGLRAGILRSDLSKLFWFDTTTVGPANDFQFVTRQEKQVISAQIIGGLKFIVSNRIFMDFEFGLGTSHRIVQNDVPTSFDDPVFDRNIRASISNKEYNNWFTPFPSFQIHIGYLW